MTANTPKIDNPTEFFSAAELAFADEGILPDGQPAPQFKQEIERPKDLAQGFVNVLNQIGGTTFIADWAKDNPGQFIAQLTKMAPKQDLLTLEGDATLTFRHALPPSALDGVDPSVVAEVPRGTLAAPPQAARPGDTPPIKANRRKRNA